MSKKKGMLPKVLILDIETAPLSGYVWGLWKQNLGVKMIQKHGYMLSYAAKWLGNPKTYYNDLRGNVHKEDDSVIVRELASLMAQADIVVAHNGDAFDIPTVKSRLIIHGCKPMPNLRTVDTCRIARREFRFPSNSLEYLSTVLLPEELRKKKSAKFNGFDLWAECLRDNIEAWEEMREYNIQDIIALEALYLKMRPFDRLHPNMGNTSDVAPDKPTCPKCGSTEVHKRGLQNSQTQTYQRFRCMSCGAWSRARFSINKGKSKINILAN